MLNFEVLLKGMGIVSPPHLRMIFCKKNVFMLHSIDWPNVIAWLSSLTEILVNMCIAIVC